MTLKNKEGSLHELTVRMCPFCETKHYFLVPCTLNGEFKKIPKEKADMFIKSYGPMNWEKKPIFVYN